MRSKRRDLNRSTESTGSATRLLAAALVCGAIALHAAAASAEEAKPYPQDGDHPLRIVHYFVAPVGRLLEWTVTRPLFAASREVAPYRHINEKVFAGCSRERPARSCTNVVH